MERIKSLDYIRVFSIMLIFLSHCLVNYEKCVWLSRFLAQSFNFLFLILSAVLFGLSWEKKKEPYSYKFLIKRFNRLSCAYYPFLFFMFLFLFFIGKKILIKDIIMHIIFLPWFDKIEGFGHLWFITMIVMCYLAIFFISKNSVFFQKYIFLLVIIGILLQIIIDKLKLPGYSIIYVILYICVFLNSSRIVRFVNNVKINKIIICDIIVFPTILLLFFNGIYKNMTISVWLGVVSAILFFISSMYIFDKIKNESNILLFFSNITFEFFLVHHALCLSSFSIFSYINNPFIATIISFILSIILAIILHYISSLFLKVKNNK